jgi:hypothetical protein
MKKLLVALAFAALFAPAAPASATVLGVNSGDLIKIRNDNDPKTIEDSVVYYLDKDWKRHPFPNSRVFNTWYRDFLQVKELSKEDMAEFRMGSSILFRPGSRLVKIPSIPKVYAVEPGGSLRWIETEAVAKALYGNDWAKKVEDVNESYFVGYREGTPLVAPLLPTGTFVRRTSDNALFVIDGLGKRTVSTEVAEAFRVVEAHVLKTTSDLSEYPDIGTVQASDSVYRDTAQLDHVETLPSPVVDVPVTARDLTGTGEQVLASFRVTGGMPVIVRKVKVTMTGALWSSGSPLLKDVRLVDTLGENLFGTRQLDTPGATSETLAFSGAYTMPENVSRIIELRATPTGTLAKGATYTVTFDRSTMTIGDATNGNNLADFWPRTNSLPAVTATVK